MPSDSKSTDIVVTARKISERLQDVPAAVSVVNTSTLISANQSRLRDYFSTIPGLQVAPTPGGSNQQSIVVRGVSAGSSANPTVGIMIDEAPFGASNYDFGPEIDPSDLQRIEVLRGPQGTLYGANSMGGVIKYVTLDPSTQGVSGRVQGGLSGVDHGGSVGYDFRGGINLPLADSLAIRVSGFTRRNPGYIDDPAIGRNDVNALRSSGGHASLLWRPAGNVTVKLSALYQRQHGEGSSEEIHAPGLAAYQQNYIPNTGQFTKIAQQYSATINASVGPLNLTSVTAYGQFDLDTTQDYSGVSPYGSYAVKLFGLAGAPTTVVAGNRRVTQEVRTTFSTGKALDWLIGGFYSDEHTPLVQTISAANVTTGKLAGTIISFDIPMNYREFALFADPTLRFTDRFSVQFGMRYSWTKAVYNAVTEQGALLPSPVVLPEVIGKKSVATYLVNPQFKFNRNLMVYARFATGYRPGRSNAFNTDSSIARVASPDTTTNYEIGFKGSTRDNIISWDASLYYIDWKDVQLTLRTPSNGLAYTANAGHAKSEGAEVAITLRPGAGWTFAGWVSLNKAEITEGVVNTSTYAPAGQLLPYSARFTANLSLDKSFHLSDRMSASLGATYERVGKRFGTFIPTPAREVFPAYDKLDLRAGIESGDWSASIYAKNVTGSHAVLGGGAGSFPPNAFLYLQPRVIGASLTRRF